MWQGEDFPLELLDQIRWGEEKNEGKKKRKKSKERIREDE